MFSVDGPVGASSQWQEVCRWRRHWIDVVLVKLACSWIISDQKVSGVDRRWGKVDLLARWFPLLQHWWSCRIISLPGYGVVIVTGSGHDNIFLFPVVYVHMPLWLRGTLVVILYDVLDIGEYSCTSVGAYPVDVQIRSLTTKVVPGRTVTFTSASSSAMDARRWQLCRGSRLSLTWRRSWKWRRRWVRFILKNFVSCAQSASFCVVRRTA